MKRIEIVVSPTGETKVETQGFIGSECLKASQFLTKALGDATGEQLKPEFYTQANNDHQVDQGL